MKKTILVPSHRFENYDNSLKEARREYAEEHDVNIDDVEAEWADPEREEIELTGPFSVREIDLANRRVEGAIETSRVKNSEVYVFRADNLNEYSLLCATLSEEECEREEYEANGDRVCEFSSVEDGWRVNVRVEI